MYSIGYSCVGSAWIIVLYCIWGTSLRGKFGRTGLGNESGTKPTGNGGQVILGEVEIAEANYSSVNKLSANKLSANKLSANKVSANKVSANKVSVNKFE